MSINKQRENSGILFKNDRKETESHPDYVGTLNVAGAVSTSAVGSSRAPR